MSTLLSLYLVHKRGWSTQIRTTKHLL